MAIKYIAAAMIAPAAIAGVALSSGSAASAATVHQAAAQRTAQAKYHQWVTVQDGDTLSGIAAAHRMSWPALYEANRARIADPDVLTTGQSLRIPADPALWAAEYTPPAGPGAARGYPGPGSGIHDPGLHAPGIHGPGSRVIQRRNVGHGRLVLVPAVRGVAGKLQHSHPARRALRDPAVDVGIARLFRHRGPGVSRPAECRVQPALREGRRAALGTL